MAVLKLNFNTLQHKKVVQWGVEDDLEERGVERIQLC
jgi:hypothetical protein